MEHAHARTQLIHMAATNSSGGGGLGFTGGYMPSFAPAKKTVVVEGGSPQKQARFANTINLITLLNYLLAIC